MKLTAAEKKLVELYRAADSDTKKDAVALLKGEKKSSIIGDIFGGKSGLNDIIGSLIKDVGKDKDK